ACHSLPRSSSLLFHSPVRPRAPPPFPTRRSSDLNALASTAGFTSIVFTVPLAFLSPFTRMTNVVGRVSPPNGFQSLYSVCPRRSDRKSTRLNSSHLGISYAVFCLKKKIIEAQLLK